MAQFVSVDIWVLALVESRVNDDGAGSTEGFAVPERGTLFDFPSARSREWLVLILVDVENLSAGIVTGGVLLARAAS